ncbi:hypothetical protein HNO88_001554 [Novosphingobium chloroacetimidivorans]|uniref:Uncharacterized protein n=1 Tax=Novosphingobium chloroacetimidivorans TaxID=1428314 RepID=A0A7W7K8K3_9SPHN|nr:hypothetical protein [Novosphingobium chloroacetimidivorans]MBB4858235.1 hypothetical protein [Novosphingobium chloroacetimidivorans]
MLEVKIKAAGRRYVAPGDLRRALGADRAREKLADAIEALVTQLDLIDGDPDFENDTSDYELSGDEHGDPAWCEWHTLSASRRRAGELNGKLIHPARGVMLEDVEDCDPAEDDDEDRCGAGEDDAAVFSRGALMGFSGDRAASDPDSEPSGDEQDTDNAEDEHKSCARPVEPEDVDRALARGFWGSGCDARPRVFDRQLEFNDN